MKELRHYSATQLLTAGTDLNTVAGRLGHAEGSTTLRFYAQFTRPADQHAAGVIPSQLAGLRKERLRDLYRQAPPGPDLGHLASTLGPLAGLDHWPRNGAGTPHRIDRPVRDIDTTWAWRGLARLLPETDRQAEAHRCFEQALRVIDEVAPHTAWAISERSNTYVRWAEVEASMGHRDQALVLLEIADDLADNLRPISRRNELIKRIRSIREGGFLSVDNVELTDTSIQSDYPDSGPTD